MKIMAWVMVAGLSCLLFPAQALPQAIVKDKLVTSILTDGLLIAESHPVLVGNPPFGSSTPNRGSLLVRVFLLEEGGECVEPAPNSCPKVKLLIAVKNLLEVDMSGMPIARVYQIPEGYGWEFAGWRSFSEDVFNRNSFTVFRMRKRVIEPSASGGKDKYIWKTEDYEISVNTVQARVAKMN